MENSDPVEKQTEPSLVETFEIAMEHYFGKNGKKTDFARAFQLFGEVAEAGHAAAQYYFAKMFKRGEEVGVEFSADQYIFWLKKSAQNGFADAEDELGHCLLNGSFVKQDKRAAVRWFKKAAEQRHRFAQLSLACCYEEGNGVRRNYKKAYFWFKKASNVLDPALKRYEFSFLERIKKLGVSEEEIEKIKQ